VKNEISQRELRNASGAIMRALDRGESFIVTRNGVPVGELRPARRRRFVRASRVLEAFRGAPPIEPRRFRREVDAVLDQDPTPRA
jgi:antitoxin (DNA-binding transcriptional repressor) of toxin-antitoxin stability system